MVAQMREICWWRLVIDGDGKCTQDGGPDGGARWCLWFTASVAGDPVVIHGDGKSTKVVDGPDGGARWCWSLKVAGALPDLDRRICSHVSGGGGGVTYLAVEGGGV
ncbi:hypothetical protein L1987_02806 [Smallanthus sonchifolius]|uniref:Uncharacterized protein n=1 Tax=Smallanthus sonchifolius TaxID=185202 RepID=A0ACB9K8Z9_9ASTR|nr:hypothetical protein L1987_02806 [Smallanthus sonchifolius]